MKTTAEYTKNNVLVIPQALYSVQDIHALWHNQHSAIFYKNLEQDLLDVTFYTNSPCLVYIENGSEELTNGNNETIKLTQGSAVFLPQGSELHSCFVKNTQSLKAYLVFFDDELITHHLSKNNLPVTRSTEQPTFCTLHGGAELQRFFESIHVGHQNTDFLNLKLQELLHLIGWKVGKQLFHHLLCTTHSYLPKRHLPSLMEKFDVMHLSVNDLAHLSGRSVSAFNRDFKQLYQASPKKWLQQKRLSEAKKLLQLNRLNVSEVAAQMGFENVSHFIKAFKQHYGVTPKQLQTAC